MSIFKKRHKHDFKELGKYYHIYERDMRGYTDDADLRYSTRYGTHVEVNILRYCTACGKSEMENSTDRHFPGGPSSPEYTEYIDELEATDVMSESKMEEKYSSTLEYIKSINQFYDS